MSEKPLGFGYQVGAGAIAGVSEVCTWSLPHLGSYSDFVPRLDLAHVRSNLIPAMTDPC
jgi:hypothetical protein